MIKLGVIGQHCERLDDTFLAANSLGVVTIEVQILSEELWTEQTLSVLLERGDARQRLALEENKVVVPAYLLKAGLLYITVIGESDVPLKGLYRVTTNRVSVRIMPSGADELIS